LDADLLALLRAAASEAFRHSFAARREGRRRPRPSPEVEEEEESGARASRRRRSTTPCSSTRPPPTTSCSPSLSVGKAYAISELKMMLILLFQKSIQAWLLVEGDSEGSAARQQSSGGEGNASMHGKRALCAEFIL